MRGMRRGLGRGPALVGALAAGLSALAIADPATAGTPGPSESLGKSKGIEYMRGRYLAVASQTSQSVKCTGTRKTLGGGGSMGGPGTVTRLNESYPAADASGWVVEGSTDGIEADNLTGFAMCAKAPVTIATDGPVEFANDRSFSPTCAGGYKATGGGFSSPGIGLEMLASARAPDPPKGRVWRSTANNGTGVSAEGTGLAACAGGYKVRIARSAKARVRGEKTGAATARCKQSEAVAGGGWTATAKSGEPEMAALATKPVDSKADKKKVPDDGWKVKVQNEGGRGTIVAQAICVKPTEL